MRQTSPDPLVFVLLELKIPPLLLMLLVASLMWLMAYYLPSISVSLAFKYIVSFNFLGIGLMFMGSALISFREAKTTLNPMRPDDCSTLVTSDVYQITRNPMYVGMLLMLIAYAVFLANAYTLVLLIAFVLYLNRFQILPEEQALTAIFGEDFLSYQAKVHRWL
ncbi:MAG: isoprenylcysteine carboxylmethyltransferase family protein [Mariprofundus sp.]|nr:isoprenylcysteine carboxylmethyltransferase family protein [Mariprofundus sp.]